jgi:hypothetical protein
MALAIGSIRLFRSGTLNLNPFGYFTAALEVWTPSMSSFNTIEDIEHFLLIAQFGFFYDIGVFRVMSCRLFLSKTMVTDLILRLLHVGVGSAEYAYCSRTRLALHLSG